MTVLATLGVVVAVVWVIARERRIYKANKAFKAQAVYQVTPPGPRWWQVLLANVIYAALIVAMVLALVRLTQNDDTTPGPTGPLDGTTDGSNPAGPTSPSPSHSSSSNSSVPKGASR
ncbi:hypothetical protein [Catenulispora rubra]|uniref:hypothetical protein n=1 Tax=Catenulispora rubra TaxID=280293 RepID=UPI0018927C25|nr:hypothetical protein [Catenulispora rubra]